MKRLIEENRMLCGQVNRFTELLIRRLELIGQLKNEPRAITPEEHEQATGETDEVYPGFAKCLCNTFPFLTGLDILFCCLIRLDFTLSGAARVMGVNMPSLSKRKSRMMKRIREVKPDLCGERTSLELLVYSLQEERKGIDEYNQWLRAEETRLLKALVSRHIPAGTPDVLSKDQHSSLFLKIDYLYPGFIKYLRDSRLKLSYDDVLVCCLLKLRFSTAYIADLTGVEPSSITKRKQRIRKKIQTNRPGIWKKYPSLDAWIWAWK